MGCGSSAAVSSASKVNAVTLRTKDAGSQTNVTVLVSSTASDSRTEAHDARKELIMQHRSQALAKARELSNSKSGYTTATYTGSGMSTPRSAYSRTHKFRGSDIGSGSDGDLKSRLELSAYDLNNSRTNLSERSGHSARKTQVSFRNDQYNKLASTCFQKRRKTTTTPNQAPRGNTILRKGRRSSRADSNHSGSSGTNSINKQADTGYDGSVSSGPSTIALGPRKSATTSDYSSTSNVNIASKQGDSIPLITQTHSNETDLGTGRLSVVVSVDEQSVAPETSCEEKINIEEASDTLTEEVLGELPPGNLEVDENTGIIANGGISVQKDTVHEVDETGDSVFKPKLEEHVENECEDEKSADNPVPLNENETENLFDTSNERPASKERGESGIDTESDNVNSNLILVSTPPVLAKSDSRISIKQIVNIESSMNLNSDAIAVLE